MSKPNPEKYGMTFSSYAPMLMGVPIGMPSTMDHVNSAITAAASATAADKELKKAATITAGGTPYPSIQAILQPPSEFTLIAGRMSTGSKYIEWAATVTNVSACVPVQRA